MAPISDRARRSLMTIAATGASALTMASYGQATEGPSTAPPSTAHPAALRVAEPTRLGPVASVTPAPPAGLSSAAAGPAAAAPAVPPDPVPTGDHTEIDTLTPEEIQQLIGEQGGDGQAPEESGADGAPADVGTGGGQGDAGQGQALEQDDLTVRVPFGERKRATARPTRGRSAGPRADLPARLPATASAAPAAQGASLPMTGLGLEPIAALGFFMGLAGFGLLGLAPASRRRVS